MTYLKCAVAAGAIIAGTAAANARTLTFATWQPEASTSLHATSLHWFAEELEKRTDGKHSLNIFWNGTVAGISDIGNAVESGLADMGDLVVPYFPDQYPLNNAISFFWPQPRTPLELSEMMADLHRKYPPFSEELTKFNLKLIGLRPLGYYGMMCREPIRSMDDFKGKRIRSYGVALPAVVEALGAVPQSMSTVEIYEALERGVIDCAPIEPILAHGWKYDEVAKYFVDVPLGASWGQFIVMNADVFEGLPDDLKQTITELGNDYHVYFSEQQEKQTAEVMDGWEKREDFEVIKIPAEEFLAVTENSPGVAKVRQQWIEKAKAAGLPADEIASGLSFK
ncbi:MAG: TRAP transporter substrate-binding protein DctP [Flavobacteriaceae bacterium]